MSSIGPTCSLCGTKKLDSWYNSLEWQGPRCQDCAEKVAGGRLIPAELATVIELRRAKLRRSLIRRPGC